MKYTVKLRMRNPGPAKYLIDSRDSNNMVEAFEIATAVLASVDENEHFVEIVDNESGDTIASFNVPKEVA